MSSPALRLPWFPCIYHLVTLSPCHLVIFTPNGRATDSRGPLVWNRRESPDGRFRTILPGSDALTLGKISAGYAPSPTRDRRILQFRSPAVRRRLHRAVSTTMPPGGAAPSP